MLRLATAADALLVLLPVPVTVAVPVGVALSGSDGAYQAALIAALRGYGWMATRCDTGVPLLKSLYQKSPSKVVKNRRGDEPYRLKYDHFTCT